MSILTTYTFSNQANFVISNSASIEVNSGNAQLKIGINSGQTFNQIFPNSSGFTFQNSYTQVQSSQLRQIDQLPANATAGATYTTNENLNWGNGTLVGSLSGATVSGGRLNCKGGTVKAVSYLAEGNANSPQTGCIRLDFIPNYTGNHPFNSWIFSLNTLADSLNNLIQVYTTSGSTNLGLDFFDSAGNAISAGVIGALSVNCGTTYEFELNFDLTAGASRLFINGTQLGSTRTQTGTRTSSSNHLVIGSSRRVIEANNCEFDNLIYFSTVQHTANYTAPSATLPEAKYIHDTITYPTFTYSHAGNIQIFTGFNAVESGAPRHTLTHQGSEKYWDGSSWNFSVGSYSQANCYQLINAKVNSLTAVNTIGIKTYFIDTNSSFNVSSLQLIYNGQIYQGSGSEQTISPAAAVNAEELLTLITSNTITGSDNIKINIIDNGTEKYFNVGSDAWLSATSGYLTATNLSDITSSNNSKLLNLGSALRWKAYLHSDLGNSTPLINGLFLLTDFFAGSVSNPDTIIVYGRTYDDYGNPIQGVTVRAQLAQVAVYNNEIYVGQNSASTQTNSDGYWDLRLIHTDSLSPATQYRITQQHCNLNQTNIVFLPNSGQYNLTSVRSL